MNWLPLIAEEQLMEIDLLTERSDIKAAILFKHSTRCATSSMALDRLERSWNENNEIPAYFLDLIRFRNLSDKIAEKYGVRHESPQILIIKNGKCIYNASHTGISVAAILAAIPDN
jgi:bacillithiol system protein YtxJ